MLYYMFPYYGSECFSNNKSHSSNKSFYIKKTIPKTNQGSSNAQKKYILKHTHAQEDRSYLLIILSSTCYFLVYERREPRCLFGLPESPLSLSFSLFFWSPWLDWQTCCSYSWDSKHKHRQYTASSYRRASRCFNQNTKKDSGTKSETLGIKNSLLVGH